MKTVKLTVSMFPNLSMNNRSSLKVSGVASCYDCLQVIPVTEIKKWTDKGKTAICPRCSVDSLVPGVVESRLLKRAHKFWFAPVA